MTSYKENEVAKLKKVSLEMIIYFIITFFSINILVTEFLIPLIVSLISGVSGIVLNSIKGDRDFAIKKNKLERKKVDFILERSVFFLTSLAVSSLLLAIKYIILK